jgi:hypothetical protein
MQTSEGMKHIIDTYPDDKEAFRVIISNLCRDEPFKAKFVASLPHKILLLAQNTDANSTPIPELHTLARGELFRPHSHPAHLDTVRIKPLRTKYHTLDELTQRNNPIITPFLTKSSLETVRFLAAKRDPCISYIPSPFNAV